MQDMRTLLLLPVALLAAGAATFAGAQSPAAPSAPAATTTREPLEARQNQKVERIRHEDAGSRIDEVRYGGQTQSITVQPKTGAPEYEVDPGSPARRQQADPREGLSNSGGQRSWNVLRF